MSEFPARKAGVTANAARREVLTLIPARGGSKGLPRKNLALLYGRPLISYSIAAALASRLVTRVIVVTEDEEIADVAREYGAEVPFLRPRELAQDSSNLDDSFVFTLAKLKEAGYVPDCVTFCFPPLPFRPPGFIDHMVGMLLRGCSNVTTAQPLERRADYYRVDARSGVALPAPIEAADASCRKAYNLFSGYSVRPARSESYCYPLRDAVMRIDIDGPKDLQLAELVLRSGLFDFGSNLPALPRNRAGGC